jgi:signal transduction histidine kinase
MKPRLRVRRGGQILETGADMRLADFIQANIEPILEQWETFAKTLQPAAADLSSLALRDHATQILEAVAKDLGTSQTRQQQSEKSMGRAPKVEGAPETAAQTHAILRARGGFDINQLVSEYRALRASVLRLWMDKGPLDASGVEDIIRFSEAIDQAIAESVGHFHGQVERARNLLLGMLGHDIRSPLATIVSTASYLAALNAGDEVSVAAARLIRSGQSIRALVDDLVDFNRTRLGLGIKIAPSNIDLATPLADELEQLRGAHPERKIELVVSGDCEGRWDGSRLQQSLRNLVSNAITYGAPGSPVHVALIGEETDVRVEVRNTGAPIDALALGEMFDPLRQGVAQLERGDPESLGLGLFIVREIARAHGGQVEARSVGDETTFVMRLPRSGRDAST